MRYYLFILVMITSLVSVSFCQSGATSTFNPVIIQPETAAYPYEAEITGDDVYVRSGAGTAYYACSKLNKGDRVTIVDDMDGVWSKIVPPAGSFSWISMQYVQPDPTDPTIGIVTGDNVNVWTGSDRVKPEVSTSKQGKLNKGETVKLLGEQLGNYYKIAVPSLPDAYLWVSTQYTKPVPPEAPKVTPIADPVAKTNNEGNTTITEPVKNTNTGTDEVIPVTGTVEDPIVVVEPEQTPLDKYYELVNQIELERAKPIEEQDYTEIRIALQEIADNKAAGKASRYAEAIIDRVKGYELALEAGKLVKSQNQQLEQVSEQIEKSYTQKLEKIQNLGKYAVVGTLENFLTLGSGYYRILDESGQTSCTAVLSENASESDLSSLIGKKVGLVGSIEPNTQTAGALVRFTKAIALE